MHQPKRSIFISQKGERLSVIVGMESVELTVRGTKLFSASGDEVGIFDPGLHRFRATIGGKQILAPIYEPNARR